MLLYELRTYWTWPGMNETLNSTCSDHKMLNILLGEAENCKWLQRAIIVLYCVFLTTERYIIYSILNSLSLFYHWTFWNVCDSYSFKHKDID